MKEKDVLIYKKMGNNHIINELKLSLTQILFYVFLIINELVNNDDLKHNIWQTEGVITVQI